MDRGGHSFDDEDYGRLAGCIENMDSVDDDEAGGGDGDAVEDGAAPWAGDFARAGSNESTLVSSPSPPRGGGDGDDDDDDDDDDEDDDTDEDEEDDGAPPPPPSSMHRHHPTSPGPFLLDPMTGSSASFPPPSSSRDPSFAVTPSGASSIEYAIDGNGGNNNARAYGASPTSLSWEECIDNLFDDIANGMSPPGIGSPGRRNGDAFAAAGPPPGEKRSSDDNNGTPLADAASNRNARSFSLKRRSGNGDSFFSGDGGGGGGGSPVAAFERERQRRRWNDDDDDDEDYNVDGGSKIPYGGDGFGRHYATDDAPIPSFQVVFGSLSKSSTEGADPPRGRRSTTLPTATAPPRLTAPPSFDDDGDDDQSTTADRLHPSMGTLERYDGELYRKLRDARPAAATIAPLPRPLVPDDDFAAGNRLAVVRCRPSATCDAYEVEDCVASRAFACRKFLAEVQFAFGGCSYLLPGLRGACGGSDDELVASRGGGARGGVSDWGGSINVSSFGSFVLGHTPGMRRSDKVRTEVWSPQSSETPLPSLNRASFPL